ncbi:MAG: hypothetical protein ACKVP2_10065 [Burkholderiales bacterium]
MFKKQSAVNLISGAALAAAAAGLFMSGVATTSVAAEGKVHCSGVNACKGKSDCKTAMSECKGQNGCKGKGFVAMDEKMCKEKGGKVEKS